MVDISQYITVEPQITFFKSLYKRHTAICSEKKHMNL